MANQGPSTQKEAQEFIAQFRHEWPHDVYDEREKYYKDVFKSNNFPVFLEIVNILIDEKIGGFDLDGLTSMLGYYAIPFFRYVCNILSWDYYDGFDLTKHTLTKDSYLNLIEAIISWHSIHDQEKIRCLKVIEEKLDSNNRNIVRSFINDAIKDLELDMSEEYDFRNVEQGKFYREDLNFEE